GCRRGARPWRGARRRPPRRLRCARRAPARRRSQASPSTRLPTAWARPARLPMPGGSDAALAPVLVAEDALQELPGVGPRKRVADLVRTRPLVVREARLDVQPELVDLDDLPGLGLHDRVH